MSAPRTEKRHSCGNGKRISWTLPGNDTVTHWPKAVARRELIYTFPKTQPWHLRMWVVTCTSVPLLAPPVQQEGTQNHFPGEQTHHKPVVGMQETTANRWIDNFFWSLHTCNDSIKQSMHCKVSPKRFRAPWGNPCFTQCGRRWH